MLPVIYSSWASGSSELLNTTNFLHGNEKADYVLNAEEDTLFACVTSEPCHLTYSRTG